MLGRRREVRDRPRLTVVFGQPAEFSTSFQTTRLARALEPWFAPEFLPIQCRAARLRQLHRLFHNYLRPVLRRPKAEFILYGNDGFADFRHWQGTRILYWYDAPSDWSKQPPSRLHWVQRLRSSNVQHADVVFCVSRAQVRLAKRLRPGAEEGVHYLPVGVDCHQFDPGKGSGDWMRKQFVLPRKIIIGYLGYLASFGGRFAGEVLTEIASDLVAKLPVHFLVVGFGPALGAFRRKTETLGVRDHFTFTGYIPEDRLPDAIAAMDICVDSLEPGFHSEARSETKLKQYMSMGRACLATDIGENRADLDEGRCGILVAPGREPFIAAITELSGNPAKRSELGARARARALQLYDWKVLAAQFAGALASTNAMPEPGGEY